MKVEMIKGCKINATKYGENRVNNDQNIKRI